MPIIQISKIQLRRGEQQDLDVNSLDSGELGFATDTGRLFIGSDPEQVGPWTSRTVLPYDAVEVLTENSTSTYARMFDRMNRIVGPTGMAEGFEARRPYVEASLAATTSVWANVAAQSYNTDGQLVSSLAFDFTSGVMPTGATLTRSSPAMRVNNAGVLVSETNNIPRFDYHPITNVIRGLLVERSSTNIILQSSAFDNAQWTNGGMTVTANSIIAPTGAQTADTLTDSSSTTAHLSMQTRTIAVDNSTYVGSVYIRKTSNVTNQVSVGFTLLGGTALNPGVWLNTNTGAATINVAGIPWGVADVGAYWHVYIVLTNNGTNNNARLAVYPARNLLGAGNTNDNAATGSAVVWGSQIEAGSAPTSYMDTTTTASSRSADVLTLNWGLLGAPDGVCRFRYTFDDLSTQTVDAVLGNGIMTVPTNLNRRRIRRVEWLNGLTAEPVSTPVVLSNTKSMSAQLEYFIFDGAKPVRNGIMTVLHDGNNTSDEAILIDEHVADFQIASTGSPFAAEDVFVSGLQFRVMRTGTNPNYSFRLQFMNTTSSSFRIQFRLMVAARPS